MIRLRRNRRRFRSASDGLPPIGAGVFLLELAQDPDKLGREIGDLSGHVAPFTGNNSSLGHECCAGFAVT